MAGKLPLNLGDLLRQRTVEGDRIEYKAGWNPDAVVRTLCAFANDFENLGGGYVVIGQDCVDGKPVFPPVGLKDNQLDPIQQELLGYFNQIQPTYFPNLSVERYEGKNLIVLWAPGGLNRPYKAPRAVTAKTKEYHYFIRRFAMIFRLSQKLNARIKGGTLVVLPLDENPFADWSVGLFQAGRLPHILVTNTKSLYSTVLLGKGVTNEAAFIERVTSGIRELLEANGHREVYEQSVAPLLGTVRFAKALNRSLTGSMNDLVKQAAFLLETGELSLTEISTHLIGTPMTGLKHDNSTHGFPRDVFNEMVKTAESAR